MFGRLLDMTERPLHGRAGRAGGVLLFIRRRVGVTYAECQGMEAPVVMFVVQQAVETAESVARRLFQRCVSERADLGTWHRAVVTAMPVPLFMDLARLSGAAAF